MVKRLSFVAMLSLVLVGVCTLVYVLAFAPLAGSFVLTAAVLAYIRAALVTVFGGLAAITAYEHLTK